MSLPITSDYKNIRRARHFLADFVILIGKT